MLGADGTFQSPAASAPRVTGELSASDFEEAAAEFARWWAEAQPGPGGGCGGGRGERSEEDVPHVTEASRSHPHHQRAPPAAEPSWWCWVRQAQPLTGEVRGYLASEVIIVTAPAPDAQGGGARAGGPPVCAAAPPPGGRPPPSGAGEGAPVTSEPDSCCEDDGESESDDGAAVWGAPAGGPGGGGGCGGGGLLHVLDLHIAYHPSYRVPLLLFRARPLAATRAAASGGSRGGAPLAHEALLELLAAPLARHGDPSVPLWAYASQLQHPVLGEPWAALHPCMTAELVRLMLAEGDGDDGGGVGAGGGAVAAAASAAAPPARRRELLRYMVAWFSAVGRAVGARAPGAPPRADA